jgi:hypothetical protein
MTNQGTTASNSLSRDASDLAEAIRSLQRVCGFSYNHDTLMLALLAAASEHGSNEFQATYAALGARMCAEVQPFRKNMDKEERYRRRRALSERFKRAFRKLEIDQRTTGLTFVTIERGGYGKGKIRKSRIQVDVDSIRDVIAFAREARDFATFRMRCFERAAEKVRDMKERHYIEPAISPIFRKLRCPDDRANDIKRYGRCIATYARKLYGYAVEDNFAETEIVTLRESLKGLIDRCFENTSLPQLGDGRVHDSVPYINNNKGAIPCTLEESGQAVTLAPPVILNGSQIEAVENDRVAESNPLDSAMRALDIVSSIGAARFNVILVEDVTKQSEVLAKEAALETVKERFPAWLERSEREHRSLVVDMKPNGQHIIQVDEASAEVIKLLAPVSFMSVETSDTNAQVWLALPEGLSDAEIADVKARLFVGLKPKGANKGASGGLRWVGTHNFKPDRKREDGSYPLVKLLDYKDGRTVTSYELNTLGLLSEPQPKFRPKATTTRPRAKRAPSYEYAMECVRRKPNGEVNRSGVDVLYAATCLGWGFDEAETVALLKEKSDKARGRRDDYAEKVVEYVRR